MKTSLKFLLLTITATALLSSCQAQTSQPPSNAGDAQTFVSKANGYSIELPKSWGSINVFGATFNPGLGDDMEELGPNLPTAIEPDDRIKYYISIEIFTKNNSHLKQKQSWLDFYKELRLQDTHYLENKFDDNTTDITLLAKPQPKCGLALMTPAEAEKDGQAVIHMMDAPKYQQGFYSKCLEYKNATELYSRTCRLIERGDKLYSFCYNNTNNLHNSIIQSIKFQ